MFSVTLPRLWSPTMLDLEPRSQLVGILVNLNAVPCKSVMEQFRPHGDCPHPPGLWGISAIAAGEHNLELDGQGRDWLRDWESNRQIACINTWPSHSVRALTFRMLVACQGSDAQSKI